MFVTGFPETALARRFEPIGLEALEAKAKMLDRLDNKYVVGAAVLRLAVDGLAAHFDMLEIDGRRAFTYETWYFDDEERRSYLDHHQGRRRRVKVRIRKYTDANLCFVEVKLKDKRGITVKKRLPYGVAKYGLLDEQAYEHIRTSYRSLYGEEFRRHLFPTLEVRYVRMTLVAKSGEERMTIDNHLHFRSEAEHCALDHRIFIIETKSANGNGIADKTLRALHQHPTKNCSKYCVGTVATGGASKYNKFRPALVKLGALPVAMAGDLDEPFHELPPGARSRGGDAALGL